MIFLNSVSKLTVILKVYEMKYTVPLVNCILTETHRKTTGWNNGRELLHEEAEAEYKYLKFGLQWHIHIDVVEQVKLLFGTASSTLL